MVLNLFIVLVSYYFFIYFFNFKFIQMSHLPVSKLKKSLKKIKKNKKYFPPSNIYIFLFLKIKNITWQYRFMQIEIHRIVLAIKYGNINRNKLWDNNNIAQHLQFNFQQNKKSWKYINHQRENLKNFKFLSGFNTFIHIDWHVNTHSSGKDCTLLKEYINL